MNLNKVFIAVITLSLAFACTKNDNFEVSQINKKTNISNSEDIKCIEGTLHFSSGEVCLNTLSSLTSEVALKTFEKSHNFTSWRTFTNSILNNIIESESSEQQQSILNNYSQYIMEDEDRIMPTIASVGYASIADINGAFYVGNVKHIVNGETVTVEIIDNNTKTSNITQIDYISPIQDEPHSKNTIKNRYTDERRETKKHKVFSRTYLFRHTVVEQINGNNFYTTAFDIQIHVSGQKKGTFAWNSYKDRFYIENLHWDLTIGGKRVEFESYRNNFSVDEYIGDLYYTTRFGENLFIKTPSAISMPSGFTCIVHRARSRSMGNCGVVTDVSKNHYPYAPVPACI